jgi:hypothetical protein
MLQAQRARCLVICTRPGNNSRHKVQRSRLRYPLDLPPSRLLQTRRLSDSGQNPESVRGGGPRLAATGPAAPGQYINLTFRLDGECPITLSAIMLSGTTPAFCIR